MAEPVKLSYISASSSSVRSYKLCAQRRKVGANLSPWHSTDREALVRDLQLTVLSVFQFWSRFSCFFISYACMRSKNSGSKVRKTQDWSCKNFPFKRLLYEYWVAPANFSFAHGSISRHLDSHFGYIAQNWMSHTRSRLHWPTSGAHHPAPPWRWMVTQKLFWPHLCVSSAFTDPWWVRRFSSYQLQKQTRSLGKQKYDAELVTWKLQFQNGRARVSARSS